MNEKCIIILFVLCWVIPGFAYESSERFISKDGYVWELVEKVPLYTDDNDCLNTKEPGYEILCEPKQIGYAWKIIINMHGASVEAFVEEEYLNGLEKLK